MLENKPRRLEETDGLDHRRLDVERLDVLPVLLKKRDEEVDALRAWLSNAKVKE